MPDDLTTYTLTVCAGVAAGMILCAAVLIYAAPIARAASDAHTARACTHECAAWAEAGRIGE